MKKYLKLIRVKHYIKNILIFLPVIFSGNLQHSLKVMQAMGGFVTFSFVASAIYILNDLYDLEEDRKHPVKCLRPIASGEISAGVAKGIMVGLLLAAFIINGILVENDQTISWLLIIGYFMLNILYSKYLKHIVLIDVFILVVFYIIRLYYGAVITEIPISSWLYLTVMSISFYLGLGKRRNELIKQGNNSRKVLQFYNKEFLDKNMQICMGCSMIFYSLWCQQINESINSILMLFTIPLVFVLCMRYSLIVEGDSQGDPVEVIFSDKMLLALGGTYGVIIVSLLYIIN